MTDPTESALWAAIDAMPEGQLRRLVLADYLDEWAGVVACGRCKGKGDWTSYKGPGTTGGIRFVECPACSGTGTAPDDRADLALALRATAAYIPYAITTGFGERWWYDRRNYDDDIPADEVSDHLPGELFDAIQTDCEYIDSDGQLAFKRFEAASAAILALCRAYIAVHCKSEVKA